MDTDASQGLGYAEILAHYTVCRSGSLSGRPCFGVRARRTVRTTEGTDGPFRKPGMTLLIRMACAGGRLRALFKGVFEGGLC